MCPWRLCNSLLVVVQALTPRLKPYCSCLVLDLSITCLAQKNLTCHPHMNGLDFLEIYKININKLNDNF